MDHATCITHQYIYLLENIEVTDNLLQGLEDVISLEDRKVIEDIDVDICISTDPQHQVQTMLSFISSKSAENFDRFVKALDATGQVQVSKMLKDSSENGKNLARINVTFLLQKLVIYDFMQQYMLSVWYRIRLIDVTLTSSYL